MLLQKITKIQFIYESLCKQCSFSSDNCVAVEEKCSIACHQNSCVFYHRMLAIVLVFFLTSLTSKPLFGQPASPKGPPAIVNSKPMLVMRGWTSFRTEVIAQESFWVNILTVWRQGKQSLFLSASQLKLDKALLTVAIASICASARPETDQRPELTALNGDQ